jgi:hypothetical protein
MTEEHEGYTPEKPAPDEHGQPGAPGADDHRDAHGDSHGDGHGHGDAALGPIDWGKWAYAILGGIAGLIVVAMFWLALGGLPA